MSVERVTFSMFELAQASDGVFVCEVAGCIDVSPPPSSLHTWYSVTSLSFSVGLIREFTVQSIFSAGRRYRYMYVPLQSPSCLGACRRSTGTVFSAVDALYEDR